MCGGFSRFVRKRRGAKVKAESFFLLRCSLSLSRSTHCLSPPPTTPTRLIPSSARAGAGASAPPLHTPSSLPQPPQNLCQDAVRVQALQEGGGALNGGRVRNQRASAGGGRPPRRAVGLGLSAPTAPAVGAAPPPLHTAGGTGVSGQAGGPGGARALWARAPPHPDRETAAPLCLPAAPPPWQRAVPATPSTALNGRARPPRPRPGGVREGRAGARAPLRAADP